MNFWKYTLNFFKEPIMDKINDIIDPIKFPCEDCLILPAGCYQLCDKVETDSEKMQALVYRAGGKDGKLHCPDCGYTEWCDDPPGGMSIHSKCGRCGHWFNLSSHLIGLDRVHVGENGKVYDQ